MTAHTSKALRVLRDQVAEELQPLCVSVLENDSDARIELERSIHTIVAKVSAGTAALESEEPVWEDTRRSLLLTLYQKQDELLQAAMREQEEFMVGEEFISPADAIRRVDEGASLYEWLPGPVEPHERMPLTETEIREIYQLNATLKPADEEQVSLGLPPLDQVIRPEQLVSTLIEYGEPLSNPIPGCENWAAPANSEEQLGALERRLSALVAQLEGQPYWVWTCAQAALLGGAHRASWDTFLAFVEDAAAEIETRTHVLLDMEVSVDPGLDLETALEAVGDMLARVEPGAGISWFAKMGNASWRRVLAACRVNGEEPATRRALEVLQHALRVDMLRKQLSRRWDALLGASGLPLDEEHRQTPETFAMARLPEIRRALGWADHWTACVREAEELGMPCRELLESTYAKPPHAEVWRVLKCTRDKIWYALVREKERIRRHRLDTVLTDVEQVLAGHPGPTASKDLLSALKARDIGAYGAAYEELARLSALADACQRRQDLLTVLEPVAPGWAEALRLRLPPQDGPEPPGHIQEAWEHRQLTSELERRSKVDPDVIQKEISELRLA